VSDTGIGIPSDRLPHIFDEFTQASDEIADRYGGTGLGLAISRRLLQLYGSDLRVTSTVGQGTTFSFPLTLKRVRV
jgi:signal transduction histidine kinase